MNDAPIEEITKNGKKVKQQSFGNNNDEYRALLAKCSEFSHQQEVRVILRDKSIDEPQIFIIEHNQEIHLFSFEIKNSENLDNDFARDKGVT